MALFALFAQQPPGWLADPHWAKPAIILWSIWGVGGAMVIYLAGLQDVPTELYEAAEIDGAGGWRRLFHVTLPCLSPVIYFTLIMGIIAVLQVFTPAYIMGGGPQSIICESASGCGISFSSNCLFTNPLWPVKSG